MCLPLAEVGQDSSAVVRPDMDGPALAAAERPAPGAEKMPVGAVRERARQAGRPSPVMEPLQHVPGIERGLVAAAALNIDVQPVSDEVLQGPADAGAHSSGPSEMVLDLA